MKNIFNELLIMSNVASLFFIALFALKWITEKYLTASWNFNILKINLLLFLIPLNRIANKILSLFNLPDVEKIKSEIVFKSDIVLNDFKAITTEENNLVINAHINNFSLTDVLIYLWLFGVVVGLVWQTFIFFKFKKQLSNLSEVKDEKILNCFRECKAKLKIKRNIRVYKCNKIYSPMLIGIFNAKILIPNKEIPLNHLEYIFSHELTHFKRKDLWWKMLSLIAVSLFWFNPFIYFLNKELNRQLEFSCDEKIVGNLEVKDRKNYCLAILESIDYSVKPTKNIGVCLGTTVKKLGKRFTKMLNFKSLKRTTKIISFVLVSVFVTVTATVSIFACNKNRINIDEIKNNDGKAIIIYDADGNIVSIDKIDADEINNEDQVKNESNNLFQYLDTILDTLENDEDKIYREQTNKGQNIYSLSQGTVTEAKFAGHYGNRVIVTEDDGTTWFYGHCNDFTVKEGDKVNRGDIIAHAGTTGQIVGNGFIVIKNNEQRIAKYQNQE